ncbi:MAG: glycosyltransferase family 4 protein [Chloroflexi bacterium]|nr:glycosyltransferase family 4 protein [Chloroflexota bacterium]
MNARLEVAMLIQGYLPRVGGAERQLAYVAPLLQAQKVRVDVITRRYRGLTAFEVVDGVPVHRMPVPGPKALASLSYTVAAVSLLRRLRPNVVHAHEMFSPATTALAARAVLGCAVVVTAHRSGVLGDVYRLRRRALGAQRINALRRNVDAFVTISREIDSELEALGIPAEQRVFIPNGVDTERFAPLPPDKKQAMRAMLGLPADAPIVIFTGRLAPEKQLDKLVLLWPAVRARVPEAVLLIVGTGDELPGLKTLAEAGVRFAGPVENVAQYLQAADMFVLPSLAEGLSVALLEAMAAGLAAVATSVGGTPEVIEHEATGWLAPPGDSAALRDSLITLLNNPDCRIRLGQRARERVIRDYTLSASVVKLRGVYEVVSERAAHKRGLS